jgi:RNA polymerase sigma factor (sigma-70 family)
LHWRKNFAAVLRAARSGEDSAWRSLYGELAPGLLGYLRARHAAQPEDLLGEVMLQIVRDLRSFDGGKRDFRAWAFTIAHHRLLDERRRAGRRPAEPMPPLEIERLGPRGDAEEDALKTLSAERVGRLLAQLSTDQQNVILLRVLGDLTCDEVAQVTGKTPGAVKQLQRRGFETIKAELEREHVTISAPPALTKVRWALNRK